MLGGEVAEDREDGGDEARGPGPRELEAACGDGEEPSEARRPHEEFGD